MCHKEPHCSQNCFKEWGWNIFLSQSGFASWVNRMRAKSNTWNGSFMKLLLNTGSVKPPHLIFPNNNFTLLWGFNLTLLQTGVYNLPLWSFDSLWGEMQLIKLDSVWYCGGGSYKELQSEGGRRAVIGCCVCWGSSVGKSRY